MFVVSVPIGLLATVWARRSLRELATKKAARIDWWGNVTFAAGLVAVMVGITYGIQPYGGHAMGWTNPGVIASLGLGVVLLVAFWRIEQRVIDPMFDVALFRVRAFAAGNLAVFLSSVGRGGLQFVLIVWLQGIWLPAHGYAFAETPLWAGIYLLPEIVGILVAGPASGYLSDRYGARPFTTGGMLVACLTFLLLILLPVHFSYWMFALILFLNGVAWGLFASPNSRGGDEQPAAREARLRRRDAGDLDELRGVLSIGIFFTLMIAGLSSACPRAMHDGLVAHGVAGADATRGPELPPVTTLFAAFLGYNPMETLLGSPTLAGLPPGQAAELTGRSFFPT